MSKLFQTLLISLLLFSSSCSEEKIDVAPMVTDLILETYIQNRLESTKSRPYNGIFVLSENGKIVHSKTQGFKDFRAKEKIDSTTQFCIGSLSKQFTAVIVLLEMEKGNLKLEDNISKYLPDLDDKFKNITIHQLLNHSSGIKSLKGKLEFTPGTDFFYSNVGYNLLGDIVAKTSKNSFSEIASELFKNCEMNSTTTADLYKEGKVATGYDGQEGIDLKRIEDNLKHLASPNIGVAAGGIISTASDLVLWNEKLHNGKILKPETYKKFVLASSIRKHPIWGTVDYGYGIQIARGLPIEYFHSGYVKGFPSLNLYFPQSKSSVIMLENVANDSKDFPYIFSYQVEFRNLYRNVLIGIEKGKALQKLEEQKNQTKNDN